MSFRTLSIGGATYDLFLRTEKGLACSREGICSLLLPLGEKIRVENVIETCGGGAANTSVGLQRLGCSAAFCGILGSDQWGERILETLRREGVTTVPLTQVEGETTSFSVILSIETGERVILYSPGTNTHLQDATFDRAEADLANWIYLNHLSERACAIEDDLLSILESGEARGFTWNPGGRELQKGIRDALHRRLLAKTSLLLLNKGEALGFTGARDIPAAFRILSDAGVSVTCITDGSRGASAFDGRSLFHCPCDPEGIVIDTTGAGDAFGTGVTWGLLEGLDLPEALRAGTLNASSVVSKIGAQAGLLNQTTMRRKLRTSPLSVTVEPLA